MLTLVTFVYLAAMTAWIGHRTPGYSAVRDTVSELGEPSAAHARLTSWGVFLPVGILSAAIALDRKLGVGHGAGLSAALGVGYLGSVAFPCDPGAPLWGSRRQLAHTAAAAIQYGGGAFKLWQLRGLHPGYAALAGLVVLLSIAATMKACAPVRGAIQRVAEACLFGALAASG